MTDAHTENIRIDIPFMRASIQTELDIFNVELETDFLRWATIPSKSLREEILVWRKLEHNATKAFEQRIVKYCIDVKLTAALTDRQNQIRDFSILTEYLEMLVVERRKTLGRSAAAFSASSGKGAFGLLRRVKEALSHQKAICFQNVGPFHQLQNGGFLYLSFSEGREEVTSYVSFCRLETSTPMNHNGLHGVISFNLEDESKRAPEVIADEILRNINKLLSNLKN